MNAMEKPYGGTLAEVLKAFRMMGYVPAAYAQPLGQGKLVVVVEGDLPPEESNDWIELLGYVPAGTALEVYTAKQALNELLRVRGELKSVNERAARIGKEKDGAFLMVRKLAGVLMVTYSVLTLGGAAALAWWWLL